MRPTIATLDRALAAVYREIKLRAGVYPKWVAANRMSKDKATEEILAMRQAGESIEWLCAAVKSGIPPVDAAARKWLEEACHCVEPTVRLGMIGGGRLGNCPACKALEAIDRAAINQGKT